MDVPANESASVDIDVHHGSQPEVVVTNFADANRSLK